MHLIRYHAGLMHKGTRAVLLSSLMVILALVFAACGGGEPEPVVEPPAATEAPAAAEEAEAEPTEAPAEEAEATEEPAEEATEEPAEEATEEPAEEATAEPEEEATVEASEEMTGTEAAAAEATTEPEEEATAEPEEEATAEPEEEATAEPEEEATAEPAEEGAAGTGDAANGEYIATLTGGCGCHFNRDAGALAGGNRFEGDFGEVYAPNLTPDPETGIGNWSEQDIAHALQLGHHPDGYQLVPVMPYHAFSALSNQEALDVAAYLFSLEPVVNEVGERAVTTEPEPFTPESEPPAEAPTDPVARGQQLATIARCGMCHTPANEDGSPNMDLFLAGAPLQDGEISANITPHEEFGIGGWTEEEIAHYMQTGERPDGSLAQGSMAQQIERRFHLLTDDDATAVAAFLKSVPPHRARSVQQLAVRGADCDDQPATF